MESVWSDSRFLTTADPIEFALSALTVKFPRGTWKRARPTWLVCLFFWSMETSAFRGEPFWFFTYTNRKWAGTLSVTPRELEVRLASAVSAVELTVKKRQT